MVRVLTHWQLMEELQVVQGRVNSQLKEHEATLEELERARAQQEQIQQEALADTRQEMQALLGRTSGYSAQARASVTVCFHGLSEERD